MASPICLIENQSSAVSYAAQAGEEITIALQDAAGVSQWAIECISTDGYNTVAELNDTKEVDWSSWSASFTVPNNSCGLLFRSVINNGRNINDQLDGSLTYEFKVHVPTENRGGILPADGETTQGNPKGWGQDVASFLRKLDSADLGTTPDILVTEDDAWSTVYQAPLTDNALSDFTFDARGMSASTSSNWFTKWRAFKSVSGVVTSYPEATILSGGDGYGDARISASGSNVLFQVKGEASLDFTWRTSIKSNVVIPASLLAPAHISSINFDLADTAGGDIITLTGTDMGLVSSCTVGGTSATIVGTTSTTVSFIMPAKTAGNHDVQVFNAGGGSNTITIEAWSPLTDPACTLLFDAKHTAYNEVTGTWTPRYSMDLGAVGHEILEMMPFSTSNQAVSDGAPSFDGNGADQGGLQNGSNAWTRKYLDLSNSGPSYHDGTMFAVLKFTNSQTLVTDTSYYNDPHAILAGLSSLGITTGLRSSDSQPVMRAYLYDGSLGGYRAAEVLASQGVLHAVVTRFGLATTIDLSVDGALSGSGYGSHALLNGLDSSYLAYQTQVGLSYPINTITSQKFAGTIPAWGYLDAPAGNTFITKFNKWKLARFGV